MKDREEGNWEGGCYRLTIAFTEEYPNKPPECKFDTLTMHPNVDQNGVIWLKYWTDDSLWTPYITARQILLDIQQLLEHPDPEYFVVNDSSELFTTNPDKYWSMVRKEARNHPI